MAEKWWKDAVVYQIYPRSFKDSNNDGIGDIGGIIEKLDYLRTLGIDAIWLSPVCKSPQCDNGYDISDYQDIDPVFGTMEDMERLIDEAKQHGIQIILDLVLNHSSDEHPWFVEAKKSRANPYHAFYVWRDGERGILPNEMRACFGGSAWEWVEEVKQYYFHQFAVKQPDLNWENPELRKKIYEMINWWMEKGIGGFRLDVIDQIAKEPDKHITANGPRLHEYIRELSANTFQRGDIVTVGEAWGANTENAALYSNPDGSELSMVFQFEHMMLDQEPGKEKWDLCELDLASLKAVLEKWQVKLHGCGWNSLFWNNHDLPRIVSRWGDDGAYREESAKMLATLLHGMQGTPFIYQGEELGMTNAALSPEDYKDIESINMYRERRQKYPEEEVLKSLYAKSRDNARTPMQWTDEAYAGFSTVEPWIRINDNYRFINAKEQQENENSIFHYYRRLIALRKQYSIFRDGDFELLYRSHPKIFAYVRTDGGEQLLVVCNFYGEELSFSLPEEWEKDGKLLLGNYAERKRGCLRPYEAAIYFRRQGAIDC